ncbi:aspartate racemase/maleate isomerase family protein [Govanella unica]|uniref:Maleate isomerase n=1 Tax=Govanella unica TaxID=2975056 RepID=A0A9X3Z669_9PROT|nr:hypothetical protein [Govania unica]MDA5192885.1 hypothetical protein [Govania unica]
MIGHQGLAYGRLGGVGVLTPSGNPTVEPELARLLGDDVLMLSGRMYDAAPDLHDRLLAYVTNIDATLATFGGVPLSVFLFACTGSCYLIGPEAETALVNRLSDKGINFITASHAIRAALLMQGATRAVLVNPYPQSLRAAALDYWQAVGLEVLDVVDVENARPGYHAIYTLTDDLVAAAVTRAQDRALELSADVVLCTGTGMATLAAALPATGGRAPVLSSNICLAWAGRMALGDSQTLTDWIAASAPWRRRV